MEIFLPCPINCLPPLAFVNLDLLFAHSDMGSFVDLQQSASLQFLFDILKHDSAPSSPFNWVLVPTIHPPFHQIQPYCQLTKIELNVLGIYSHT